MFPTSWSLLLVLLSLSGCVSIRFQLSSIFADNMVMQRDASNRIWGWAPPGSAVFTTLVGQGFNATVGPLNTTATSPDGLFIQEMPIMSASGSWSLFVSLGAPFLQPRNTTYLSLTGIYYGDVILCSGQSNIQIDIAAFQRDPATAALFNLSAEVQAANAYGASIRLFQAAATVGAAESLDVYAVAPDFAWAAASNLTVATFSASCWFAGRAVVDGAHSAGLPAVVVGLISSSWGGTRIFAWSPPAAIAACPAPTGFNASAPCEMPCDGSSLYNGMIAPLAVGPLALRAIVWWQGENDRYYDPPTYYACALPALIDSWRAAFADTSLPWLTVQLSAWDGGQCLADFRAMQAAATATRANASTVITLDLGDADSPAGNVHSRRKAEQGARIGASLLALMYGCLEGKTVQTEGPTYASALGAVSAQGVATALISFQPSSLGPQGTLVQVPAPGVPTLMANQSCCPASFAEGTCAWYSLHVSFSNGTGVWLNATASLVAADADAAAVAALPGGGREEEAVRAAAAPATQLLLTAQAAVPADSTVTATSYGWAAWPVVEYTNAAGLPMIPWLVNLTSPS
jgi:sialate O-acetylesterase